MKAPRLREDIQTGECGALLIEVLVSLLLLSLIGLGAAMTTAATLRATGKTLRNATAAQLALDKLEQCAARDPLSLQSENDAPLIRGVEYLRNVTVTANGDASRTVVVQVRSRIGGGDATAELRTTFAPWGAL